MKRLFITVAYQSKSQNWIYSQSKIASFTQNIVKNVWGVEKLCIQLHLYVQVMWLRHFFNVVCILLLAWLILFKMDGCSSVLLTINLYYCIYFQRTKYDNSATFSLRPAPTIQTRKVSLLFIFVKIKNLNCLIQVSAVCLPI